MVFSSIVSGRGNSGQTSYGWANASNTPFRRFGEQEEVYGTIHYLISGAASFVTGTVAPVDGGFSCFSGV